MNGSVLAGDINAVIDGIAGWKHIGFVCKMAVSRDSCRVKYTMKLLRICVFRRGKRSGCAAAETAGENQRE